MYLLVPSDVTKIGHRTKWFKSLAARELARKKGVTFGFEVKGQPETVTESLPLFWGYHVPNGLATEWYYHPEKRTQLISRLKHLAELKPNYINFHGIHLRCQPPAQEYIHRYINRSDPEEYLKVLEANLDFIEALKKALPGVRLTQENHPLYEYYLDNNNKPLPLTYLSTGTGRLNDLLYLRDIGKIEILLDTEHLILTLNFLNRKKNYQKIPVEKIIDNDAVTQKVNQIFGFHLEKDVYPYVDDLINLKDMISKISAKIYHLTGSTQDVIPGEKILTHAPIELGDKTFRRNLRLVLAQKPEALLLETGDSTAPHGAWKHLRPNETELSFYNLCEILQDEL